MWILEKLNFKISRGSMPPNPSSVTAPLALDPILVGSTLYCFRRACSCVANVSMSFKRQPFDRADVVSVNLRTIT